MNELESVVLTRDLPDHELETGDVGVIVHCHSESAFEVEFITGEGVTVAVVTLGSEDLRLMDASEILHVRSLAGG